MFGKIKNIFAGKGEQFEYTPEEVIDDQDPLETTEGDTPEIIDKKRALIHAISDQRIADKHDRYIDGPQHSVKHLGRRL